MNDVKDDTKENNHPSTTDVKEVGWGDMPEDNLGYRSKEERLEKRGLEDWEMVEHMGESDQGIPYWFFAIFIVLLLIAVGLTFPFWGNRPGYERDWWDWGIPAGMAWVIIMSLGIYYFVDGKDRAKKKREEKEKAEADAQENSDQ